MLTGEFATEVSDASGMQLLDIPNRCWSGEVLEKLDIDKSMLAKVYESPEITGYITEEAAKLTGLAAGTPVVGGAGDNAAAAVGTGVVEEGKAFTTIGTSGVVFAHSDKVTIDPQGRVHTFCSAVPGCWTVMSCTLAAGLSLKWYRDQFCQAEREAERQKLAREEESHFRTYRDREYGTNPPPRAAKSLVDKPQPDATKSRTIRTSKPAADATRTVQVPQSELRAAAQKAAPAPQPVQPVQTTQQFIPESAQAPQIVPQTQPKPAVPAPEAAPKRRGPVGMPRTYAEAEAALNERIRADHIWLSNPVLVRGLGMAPVIGAALDGQRALMLCIAALILVTFTRVLAVAVCHLTKNRFRPVVYCYSAALLYIPTYILLYRLFGTDLSLLGIYLPIMVVEPAIVKRMEFADLEPVKDAFRHGFNNALGMCIVLLIVGCLRELLATGAVFGNVILHNALLPLAALPAGGFVIVGILAAVWCAAANLYTDYKHEEVRRLYADRKH